MGMKDLLSKQDQATWDNFMKKCYDDVRKEHTSSWISWGKSLIRPQNRTNTAIATAGQVATVTGAAAGAAGGAGVTFGAFTTGAGVTAAAAGAAIAVYALPLVVTAAAVGYWGKGKYDANKVNQEIWHFWKSHTDPQTRKFNATAKDVTLEQANNWLDWFATTGTGNMVDLIPKLNEAKNAYQKKRDEIENRAKLLPAEIAKAKSLAPKPGVPQTPQQQQAYQQAMTMVKAKVDKIADDYMTLGKDLLYIAYRLERILMYHQMHHLAVTARTEHTHLTREKLEQDTRQYFELEKGAYENALWDKVVNLQIP